MQPYSLLDNSAHLYSYFSMATIDQTRLASASAYKRKLKPTDIPQGYTLDAKASGQRAKVFVNNNTKNVMIAHRGTAGLADVSAVIGGRRKQSKRFKHAQKVTNAAKAKYAGHTITATGHSLGGTLAQDTKGTNTQATFKGTLLHDVLFKRRKSTQRDYRNKGDVYLDETPKGGKESEPFRQMEEPVCST
jgi:hypothetical protein